MGGFFGVVSKHDAISDVFFGTDYHSHLGTRRGGLASFNKEEGLQRKIHNIENSPFRTKFEKVFDQMWGNSAIGCISDTDPQPLLVRSKLGSYAICIIGLISNTNELIDEYLLSGGHFGAMTGGAVNSTDLVAAFINKKESFEEGIKFVQSKIKGSASILILRDNGSIIAARDKLGRLPVLIGKNEDGYCVSFESFAYKKLDYDDEKELGPGEIVEISLDGIKQLNPPFIKYTPTWPRSFMSAKQSDRTHVAKMKMIPVHELIKDKNLLFVDDSIVRGTQLKGTVDFLYDNGAKEVHMRSACPPIMYACKYLNFSRNKNDMDLIARRVILELEGEEGFNHIDEYSDSNTERGQKLRKTISDKFNFASLEFQSLEGIIKAIGIDECKLCTYCWSGKE